MYRRIVRWVAGAALVLALAVGLLCGGTPPQVVYGAGPTPTSTPPQTNSNPGGSGGGGG